MTSLAPACSSNHSHLRSWCCRRRITQSLSSGHHHNWWYRLNPCKSNRPRLYTCNRSHLHQVSFRRRIFLPRQLSYRRKLENRMNSHQNLRCRPSHLLSCSSHCIHHLTMSFHHRKSPCLQAFYLRIRPHMWMGSRCN